MQTRLGVDATPPDLITDIEGFYNTRRIHAAIKCTALGNVLARNL